MERTNAIRKYIATNPQVMGYRFTSPFTGRQGVKFLLGHIDRVDFTDTVTPQPRLILSGVYNDERTEFEYMIEFDRDQWEATKQEACIVLGYIGFPHSAFYNPRYECGWN